MTYILILTIWSISQWDGRPTEYKVLTVNNFKSIELCRLAGQQMTDSVIKPLRTTFICVKSE